MERKRQKSAAGAGYKGNRGGARAVVVTLLAAAVLGAGLAAWTVFRPDGFPTLYENLRALLPWVEAEDWSHTVAYVPLDDRTDNLEDVELLAEASGWTILLPDRDWFRTALDGQPRNANGTGHGNREALLEWVREMDAAGCDRFILSLDQLFSGGLVHSRTVGEPWPLTFSDGTTMDEAEAFRQYILPLAEDPDNRVYLFDSVLRLSPTVGYQGVTTEEYYALREYGMTARPKLPGRSLETIFSLYHYAEDSVTMAEDALGSDKFREYLTEDLIQEYLSVRRRKLSLTDSFLTELGKISGDNVYLLIGIDDSSNRPNIQYNELRYLEMRQIEVDLFRPGGGATPSRPLLMAGLDSLARLLLCRMAVDEYGEDKDTVKASVRYIGGTESKHSSEFDLYTLEEVADLHLDLFGAEQVPEDEAEMQFVVMTAPDDPSRAEEYIEELLSALEENLRRHIPTVLDEASNNAYGDELEQALLDRVPFASLAGFAGKYDQANVTGAAFAMGFSRYLYLKHGRTEPVQEQNQEPGTGWLSALTGNTKTDRRTEAETVLDTDRDTDRDRDRDNKDTGGDEEMDPETRADLAHLRQMANSMALTEYILHVRAPLNEYAAERGLDWNNMRFPRTGAANRASGETGTITSGETGTKSTAELRILRKLETLFRPDLDRVCENLRGSRLLTGVDPWEEREVGDVTVTDLYFPWNRTFEVAFTVEAAFADEAASADHGGGAESRESKESGYGQKKP